MYHQAHRVVPPTCWLISLTSTTISDTHGGHVFSLRVAPPPPCADTTLGALDVTQFRLYQHHGLNITPPHHHTLKRLCILELQTNVFFRVRCRFKQDLIRRGKKSILKCVLMTLDPISMLFAIILILFPFSHLCWLLSLTNAALLLWH